MARGGIIGSRSFAPRRSGWITQRLSSPTSSGAPLVQLATDPAKLASDLAQEAADAISTSIGEKVPPYLNLVRSQWPVKTGYSKSQFRIEIKQVGPFFMARILNLADYSGWIRHKNERPVLVAIRLLFDPFTPTAVEIAREVADYVGD